ALLTMSAVAYYTTPYEMVSRMLIISGSFMGVMFPAFSVFSLENREKLAGLHQKSIRYLLLALLPIVIFLILAARPLLYYWLGTEFAEHSTVVLQLLAVGILVNSIASVPYTVLQAIGRPDITAKLHMVELPIYLAMIWFFTQLIGIVGVALAWVVRVVIDGGLLLFFCNRLIRFMGESQRFMRRQLLFYAGLSAAVAVLLYLIEDINVLLGVSILASLLSFYIIWTLILHENERRRLIELYHQLKRKEIGKKPYDSSEIKM